VIWIKPIRTISAVGVRMSDMCPDSEYLHRTWGLDLMCLDLDRCCEGSEQVARCYALLIGTVHGNRGVALYPSWLLSFYNHTVMLFRPFNSSHFLFFRQL